MYPGSKPDRRRAIEFFIDFVLGHPEVRIVTPSDVLNWLREPVALER
ncbi:hypothetical protein N9023_05415 [Opitutaceae bacterium]|nr:hypothetical protein [Opitutaceae bacterium]